MSINHDIISLILFEIVLVAAAALFLPLAPLGGGKNRYTEME